MALAILPAADDDAEKQLDAKRRKLAGASNMHSTLELCTSVSLVSRGAFCECVDGRSRLGVSSANFCSFSNFKEFIAIAALLGSSSLAAKNRKGRKKRRRRLRQRASPKFGGETSVAIWLRPSSAFFLRRIIFSSRIIAFRQSGTAPSRTRLFRRKTNRSALKLIRLPEDHSCYVLVVPVISDKLQADKPNQSTQKKLRRFHYHSTTSQGP